MAREGNLTEFEKLRIIHCYELGMEIEVVATVFGQIGPQFAPSIADI